MANGKMKILLIEDDAMISNMYKTKLEQSGYEITPVMDGSTALETGLNGKFDLILLDVILPQLDGFSILERLRMNASTKKTPIIMLTNLGTEEDMEKGKEMGANDYLVKANLTPAEVVTKVEKFLK